MPPPGPRALRWLGVPAYGAAFWFWGAACITVNLTYLPSPWVGVPEYLVWLGIDLFFERLLPSAPPSRRRRRLVAMTARGLLAAPVFYAWTVYFLSPLDPDYNWLRSHVSHGLQAMWLFVIARPTVAATQAALWAIVYVLVWRRANRFRFALGVIWPVVFCAVNYLVFYTTDWGGVTRAQAARDPAVTIIAPLPKGDCAVSLRGWLFPPYFFPRALHLDQARRRLYWTSGAIWSEDSPCANFHSVDLDGRNYAEFMPRGGLYHKLMREFQPDPSSPFIYLAGWNTNAIYQVDKNNLSETGRIALPGDGYYRGRLDIYDIVHDVARHRVLAIAGHPPAVLLHHTDTGRTELFDLHRAGLSDLGTILHTVRYDPRRDRYYAIAVDSQRLAALFEIDPNGLQTRLVFSTPLILVAVELDPLRNEILLGGGTHRGILALDADTFAVKRDVPTPTPVIRRILPCPDRDSWLVTEHLAGRLTELEPLTGAVRASHVVGDKPIGIARDGGFAYVVSTLGVVRVALDPPAKGIARGESPAL